MRIAICDDSQSDGKQLSEIIRSIAKESNLNIQVSQFTDGETLLSAASAESFDLCILDIIMPALDGIMLAQEIRATDTSTRIVFLSTSNEYAHQSYRVAAYDYLLKPVDKDQIHTLIGRLYAELERKQAYICLQRGREFIRLPIDQLSHLEVNQKTLYFCLVDGRVWQIPGTLAKYESFLLSDPQFVKIHRSYIVNLQHIAQLSPKDCVMFSGKNLPVSRTMYNDVKKRYMASLFGNTEV